MRISYTGVHKFYYYNRYLLLITKSRIYDKEKRKQVKVVLLYQSAMESYTLLFDNTNVPELFHSQVVQAQVAYACVKVPVQ